MKLRIERQVRDFIRTLPPATKIDVRSALEALEAGKGDVKALEGPLAGWCRLRVGRYRILLRYRPTGMVECVFAEHRSLVYEAFASALEERLRG
jgi:mRNA-degrading endonuclease RelE of RelBE toxin-antitoxin system